MKDKEKGKGREGERGMEGKAFPLLCFYNLTTPSVHFTYEWRFRVVVTRWSRSTQLLYIEPG